MLTLNLYQHKENVLILKKKKFRVNKERINFSGVKRRKTSI